MLSAFQRLMSYMPGIIASNTKQSKNRFYE